MKLRNIVIAYDGFARSEPLPAKAVALAVAERARLHVVHVVDVATGSPWKSDLVSADELVASVIDERSGQLENLVAPLRGEGIEVGSHVRVGTAHVEIIREVQALGADLLIVTDEPRGREGGRSFGATTMKLVRKCPCPVWAKRSAERTSYDRIMAAIDVFEEEKTHLGRKILEMATVLIRGKKTELYLFHAWSLWGEQLLHHRMGEADFAALVDETRQGAQAGLDALLSAVPLEGIDHRILLEKGEPKSLILAALERHRIDLLIMGTISRHGLPGLVIGNTAERILNRVRCSVLTVKPEGFVSPVH